MHVHSYRSISRRCPPVATSSLLEPEGSSNAQGILARRCAHQLPPQRREGATAVEYGLISVSLIAVAIIAGVTLLGGNLQTMFNGVAGKIDVTP